MFQKSCKYLWISLAILAVAAFVTLTIIDTLGDAPRGPGGMDASCFYAAETAVMVIGAAIGYGRKGSWTILTVLLMLVLVNREMYFSAALYKAVRGAPVPAIAHWIAALLFGIGGGYLGRCKDERRSPAAE